MRAACGAGLKPRDVALAKSLNTDKLSQLFVKVDESTLDDALVAPHTHPDLPAEARSLLVLKRGTGCETNTGLLLVQKLDYLQLLVVEAVTDAAERVGGAWCAAAKRIARAGAGAGAAAAAEAAKVVEETGVPGGVAGLPCGPHSPAVSCTLLAGNAPAVGRAPRL